MASIVRAAFDVGSGATKVSVAVVEAATSSVLEVLYEAQAEVLLRHDLQAQQEQGRGSRLSESIIGRLCDQLETYIARAREEAGRRFPGEG